MRRISSRDKVAYIGQGPASSAPSAFPANPFNPNAGEPRKYEGIDADPNFKCPKCFVKLFTNAGSMVCPNCSARFSKEQYDSSYSQRGMNPGLYNLDGSNTNNPDMGINYHPENSTGLNSGSWTGTLGK